MERCKGMRDLLPADMEKFRYVSEAFRYSCLRWGYEEVRTPTLEYLHLFTSAGTLTPSMLERVYSFLDWDGWSGERVVLRPDATIPVARLYAENFAGKELAKLFYVVNTFIFEASGQKEREKWQAGAELIGIGSPLADVELIVLAFEILKNIGLDNVQLRLSHAGLTRGILQHFQSISSADDKVYERLLDGDSSVIEQFRQSKPELVALLEPRGKSPGFIKNIAASLEKEAPELKPQIDDFSYVADTLQKLGIRYEIDMGSVRGFEYYTGTFFQLSVNDERVGGGGRYDALIPPVDGKSIPASGFALYLDLLMRIVDMRQARVRPASKIEVKIEPQASALGFAMADLLRDVGLVAKLNLGGKGPADTSWKLEVRTQAPPLILTDLRTNKRYELTTSEDVLERLKR